jgi:adenine-specific DNA-methyltransferase
MNKLNMRTPELSDEKFAALAAMFPNAVTETVDENGAVVRAIDADVLRQEINTHVVQGKEERYAFTWPDKKKSVLLANSPIAAALRPCREESVDFDTTENLYIEGDNLDVLKLLRETYLNKVKMIYIDPPYNTGNDFVYNDDFSEDADGFLSRDGQYDEDGNRMVKNLDSNGRFHTDWLNMIYPRLRIARDLLTDDGVIFISIDDGEVENLKKICNEVFGESNFVGEITRATGTTTGQDANKIGASLDYLVVYAKSLNFTLSGVELNENDISRFTGEDKKGKFSTLQMRKTGNADRREDRPSMYYAVTSPEGKDVFPIGPTGYESRWRFGKQTFLEYLEKDMIVWQNSRNGELAPYVKYYLDGRTKQVSNLWQDLEGNKKGSIELKDLLSEKVFDNPKPTDVLRRIITISNLNKDDIVLDFFSGSATTAHAVMQLNAEDGGKRKFIMVQLPELTDESSEAYKAGYKNICEIGKERIRRAGAKIREQITGGREQNDCTELQRAGCLAKINNSYQGNLQTGEVSTQDGDLCAFGPNEKSGSVNSIEHSGGARSELNQGVYQLSLDSERVEVGTGNAIDNLHRTGLHSSTGVSSGIQPDRRDREDDICPYAKTENCPLTSAPCSLDIGFRVLKLDSSNMKDVYYTPDEYAQMNFAIDGFADNIKADRSDEDLLFQVMLDLGVPLSSKIRNAEFGARNCKVFNVDDGYLIACFEKVDTETITEIAKQKPYYAVFRDSSFANDSAMVNFEQVFKTYSPDTIRRVL